MRTDLTSGVSSRRVSLPSGKMQYSFMICRISPMFKQIIFFLNL